jgi:hypothetical protein
MQTAIITNGDAFGSAATTHEGITAESYIAALRNCRMLRRQIRYAKRRHDERTLGEIARGLAAANRCESESELVGHMQFINGLIEQTRPLDAFRKVLKDVEDRLFTGLEDLVAHSEEARHVARERLEDWRRDVERTETDLERDRALQERLAGILSPRPGYGYDASDAYGDEVRASGTPASGAAPLGDAAPGADQYAATGDTLGTSTLVGDAPPSRQRAESRAARSSASESGQRPSRKA